jgi:hypothetical protein
MALLFLLHLDLLVLCLDPSILLLHSSLVYKIPFHTSDYSRECVRISPW